MSCHIGLAMIALITSAVQFCPWQKLLPTPGWSLSSPRGVIHVTGGSSPRLDVLDDPIDGPDVLRPPLRGARGSDGSTSTR